MSSLLNSSKDNLSSVPHNVGISSSGVLYWKIPHGGISADIFLGKKYKKVEEKKEENAKEIGEKTKEQEKTEVKRVK
jgi:hypothetical protein